MEEGVKTITWAHLLWDMIVFIAVCASVLSVSLEVLLDVDESRIWILFLIDAAALAIFALDLLFLWRHFRGSLREFFFRNWLDVLAVIPIFRIIRVARFARILKLERLRRVTKLRRIEEVEEKVGSA